MGFCGRVVLVCDFFVKGGGVRSCVWGVRRPPPTYIYPTPPQNTITTYDGALVVVLEHLERLVQQQKGRLPVRLVLAALEVHLGQLPPVGPCGAGWLVGFGG